jgi:hypothetical protein
MMFLFSGCASMFYASTQMPVQNKEELAKIRNPVLLKIAREDNMWGGAIPFVVYDGAKEIGQLGPAGSFEWKREAGYLNLKITGATRVIVGPNLPEESVYEDYLQTGSTLKFISGLNVDGKIAIWIKSLQERAPEDFVAFGRAENANTINAYGEFMKAYVKSSKVDNAIRRCDKLFEDSGMLSIENLHNKNIKMIKAYLSALPKGKHAQYAEEVDQYYEAERRPNKKSFEDYLQKWPNGQFARWAKVNLAFVSLGEATDQSLIKTQERARQIAQSGFKQMLQYMHETKKNVSTFTLAPKNTGYATESLPKSTDIKILPASGLAFIQVNNRNSMQLNALADIEGLVAQFEGTLNCQKSSTSSCYYTGTATVDGFKDSFFLKINVLAGRQVVLSGLLEGSWISIKNKEYYYDGKNWIHGLDNPFFTINKRI